MTVPPVAARRSRAPGLAPDERRRAIVEAAIPLLVEHGAGVTTRRLAEAAGVAEGTLFRVFADKAALLHAAAHAVLDPQQTRCLLAEVDPALSLPAMVHVVAEHLLERSGRAMAVLVAVRSLPAAEHGHGHRPGPPAFVLESHRAVLEGLTELFGRYQAELRVQPDRAALVLRALVSGSRQPWSVGSPSLTALEIAGVVVAGVRGAAPDLTAPGLTAPDLTEAAC